MDLNIALHPAGQATDAVQQGIDEVNRLCFGDDEDGRKYQWAGGQWSVTGSLEGKIVASLEILDRTAKVGSTSIRLGGIGGVATHPDYRRRGFAAALMKHAAGFLRDSLQVDFGLLVCHDQRIPLYSSVGWQVVEGPLVVDQPSGKIVFDAVIMILPCRMETWPAGTIDLCGLPW